MDQIAQYLANDLITSLILGSLVLAILVTGVHLLIDSFGK